MSLQSDPAKELQLLREITILLGHAYDDLYDAAKKICELSEDTYNRDFRDGHPQSGLKRLIAQLYNQHRHYKEEFLFALYDKEACE